MTPTPPAPSDDHVNEVHLVGRVSAAPEERVMPSGDVLWTFRLVVGRPVEASTRNRVDTIDCAAWTGRTRQSVSRWSVGDVVEVHGRLRRRFYPAGASSASRVEIEVERTRLRRRART